MKKKYFLFSFSLLLASCHQNTYLNQITGYSFLPSSKPTTVVKIGLLDSVIDFQYSSCFKKDTFQDPYDFIDDDTDVSTTNLHGTFLSLLMCGETDNVGINKYLQIVPIRIINELGTTTPELILKGLDYAEKKGCSVVNMSFGSSQTSEEIKNKIEGSEKGIFFFASSGDNKQNSFLFPASLGNVFAVSAVDQNGTLFANSNTDEMKTSIKALGVNIKIPLISGKFITKTGSSYATAIVSSIVATCLSYNCLSEENLRSNNLYDKNGILSIEKFLKK
ncbi:MAG: S8/S53 family peptidase [Bacilli bacterium]